MKRTREITTPCPRAVRYALIVMRFMGATLRIAFRLTIIFLKTALIVMLWCSIMAAFAGCAQQKPEPLMIATELLPDGPILGLELTATPFVETAKGPVQFKNVIYDYPLSKAMQDGFVKEPAVVTQKNFGPAQFTPAQIQEIKLQHGVRLHESTKVELETYARQTGQRIVKPFMLIIARDTTHASELMQLIQSEKFFDGRYKDKVIQVDSSRTGAEEEEMVQRLLAVESPEEPTEIVIHVNMLKEGWDVTNL